MTRRLAGKSRRAMRVGRGHADEAGDHHDRADHLERHVSTSPSWNSSQAERYQLVVQPSGSHVPSQRVANELVTTAAMIANEIDDEDSATIVQTDESTHSARGERRSGRAWLSPSRRRPGRDRTSSARPSTAATTIAAATSP